MARLMTLLQRVNANERGHAAPPVPALTGAAGAIVLAVDVAADSSAAAITGGTVLAVGLLPTSLVYHIAIDYGIHKRLDELEK